MNLRSAAVVLGVMVVLAPLAEVAAQTPDDTLPGAPTDARLAGGVLTWTDNADNEEGFRIVVELRGDLTDETLVFEYEVGPESTSFALPAETQGGCPEVTSITVAVVAFNAEGESEAAIVVVEAICPVETPPPAATATPAAAELPATGTGTPGEGSVRPAVLLLAAGALAVLAVAGFRRRSR